MGGSPWPSTIGLATAAAYWLLYLLLLLVALSGGLLVAARNRLGAAAVPAVFLPIVGAVGMGATARPGWGMILSGMAILFSIWWLHNMAKRDL